MDGNKKRSPEPAKKKQRLIEQHPDTDSATEDSGEETLPACITGHEAACTIADATGTKQMFTKSFGHRDDWLHRGIMLRDMDYYHYARYIDRIEKPRSGTAQSFQKQNGIYFLFDDHYVLATNFVQVLRRQPKTVQNVGPQCKRSDVNGGEDNAVFKAYSFLLVIFLLKVLYKG